MDEYMEEGPSLPINSRPMYGGRRKKVDKIIASSSKAKTRSRLFTKVQDEFVYATDVPMVEPALPTPSLTVLHNDPRFVQKVVYYNENLQWPEPRKTPLFDFNQVLDAVTEDMQGLMVQKACKVKELDQAVASKSTIVHVPVDIKLTDKHLAEMPNKPKRDEEIIWPHRWQFDEHMGSFLCVVERLDKNNYEFKVLMIPGSYTDDPVTLAMLMKLFNPLYQVKGDSREAALEKAKMMVATAANEFFGPQIVDSCIAVWLSGRRNQHITIKKSNIIYKLNNHKLSRPSVAPCPPPIPPRQPPVPLRQPPVPPRQTPVPPCQTPEAPRQPKPPTSTAANGARPRTYPAGTSGRQRKLTTTTKYTYSQSTAGNEPEVRLRKGTPRERRTVFPIASRTAFDYNY